MKKMSVAIQRVLGPWHFVTMSALCISLVIGGCSTSGAVSEEKLLAAAAAPNVPMQIYVLAPWGDKTPLTVMTQSTVMQVKELIDDTIGMPPEEQCLVGPAGQLMRDAYSLAAYDIRQDESLQVYYAGRKCWGL